MLKHGMPIFSTHTETATAIGREVHPYNMIGAAIIELSLLFCDKHTMDNILSFFCKNFSQR